MPWVDALMSLSGFGKSAFIFTDDMDLTIIDTGNKVCFDPFKKCPPVIFTTC